MICNILKGESELIICPPSQQNFDLQERREDGERVEADRRVPEGPQVPALLSGEQQQHYRAPDYHRRD